MDAAHPFFSDERMLDRTGRRDVRELWAARAGGGMLATSHYLASAAGAEMLARGGNAVDAAMAASFALGVVEPGGSGLGGMAMMLLHVGGRTLALPGPCRAPRDATPAVVARCHRRRGYKAVAVPAYAAVLDHAHQRYGTLPLPAILAPAIRLAREGYLITPLAHWLLERYRRGLLLGNAGAHLLGPGGAPPPVGTRIRNPALGNTLAHLAEAGLRDFYSGQVASRIAADMALGGGFITAADLAAVHPQEATPLVGSFGGLEIRAMGPPGDGTTLLQMLHLWDEVASPGLDPDAPAAAVRLAAVIRRARQDRRGWFRGRSRGKEMPDRTSRDQARAAAKKIRADLGETAHLSVMDRQGTAVALTQSLERTYGAKILTPGLGFPYNSYMRTFKIENSGHPHFLRPGAVARSNAAPTIAFRDGQPYLAIGSTGSERIVSGIFQVLVRLRVEDPFAAVAAPRLHCTPEGEVPLEAGRFPAAALAALTEQGFIMTPLADWSFKAGGLQLVVREGETFTGVADPRRDGTAVGVA